MSKSLENIAIRIRMNGHVYHLFTTFDVTESRYDYYFRTEKKNRDITSVIKELIVNVISRFEIGLF